MKIYTKTGDEGETSLLRGRRVSKDDPQVEATGTIDELNSYIGWMRALPLDDYMEDLLGKVQNLLFDIGAELAGLEAGEHTGRSGAITKADVDLLEKSIDRWEKKLVPMNSFILPVGSEMAARAHVVRALVRRAERRVVRLQKDIPIPQEILKYLNRLSDFMFVMARVLNKQAGIRDVKWKKKGEE